MPSRAVLAFTAATLGAEHFEVTAFSTREQLSHGYVLRVSVVCAVAVDELIPAVLGQPAALMVGTDGKERFLSGFVREVRSVSQPLQPDADHPLYGYEIVVVPRIMRLGIGRDSRIFQQLRFDQVVTQILEARDLAHEFQLRAAYPLHEYLTQFHESDWSFIRRLLADAGVFFYFEQPESAEHVGEERLVFADDASAYPAAADEASPATFVARHVFTKELTKQDELRDVVVREALRPEVATYRAYDMVRPNAELRAKAGAAPGNRLPMELYGHTRGGLTLDWEKNKREAQMMLDRARRGARTIEGEGISPAFRVGHRFTLEDELSGRLDGEYVIVGLRRHWRTTGTGNGDFTYRHRFVAVPADVPYRPSRVRRRRIHSCMSARVVGPVGEEVFVDPHGQVKVQFQWDRVGKFDDKSSCWVRVSQPWAGAQWGAQFIPRVGTEVVVAFDDGNPDRPIIIGQVYNGVRAMPFDIKNKTRTGFVSRVVGGAGKNELYLDDANGRETVQLSAQRDFNVDVTRDQKIQVRGTSSVNVAGRLVESVAGGRIETVAGASVSTVSGTRTVRTNGSWQNFVGGGALNDVKGDFELRIREQFRVASSGLSFVVGDKRAPGTLSTYVTGAHSMGASQEISLRSEAGIELTCGASSLVITPSGVKIKATKLEFEAAEGLTAVSSKGAALVLTEDAKVSAGTIRMFAPNGSFTLDDKGARLSGNLLFLDAAPEANKSDPMKDPEAKTKPLHVQLSDIDFKAYANLHFHVLVDGSLLEGITDGEGMVDKEVPETAKRATILLWPKDYPKGQSLKWDIDLVDAIPPPETVQGAKTRLKNLGYYTGALNDDEGEDFREALLELQRDSGVPATGKLDPDTIDQLEKYHTS